LSIRTRSFGTAQARVGTCLRVVQAVIAIELALLALGELTVGVDLGGVLDGRLLERHPELAVGFSSVAYRHERALGAEHAGVDQRPLGLVGLSVEIDLLDLADLVAVGVAEGLPAELQNPVLLETRHEWLSLLVEIWSGITPSLIATEPRLIES